MASFGLQKETRCMKALTPVIRFAIFGKTIPPTVINISTSKVLCLVNVSNSTQVNIVTKMWNYFHRLQTTHHLRTVNSVPNVLCIQRIQGSGSIFRAW